MLPAVMPGVKYSAELGDRVDELIIAARNVRSGRGPGNAALRYLRFANEAAQILGGQFTPAQIDQLVLTPTYWRLQSSSTLITETEVVEREVLAVVDSLEICRDAIRRVVLSWPSADYVIVPDTNVLLQGTGGVVIAADWHSLSNLAPNEDLVIVLLQSVIGELDKHKGSSNRDLRHFARAALKDIAPRFAEISNDRGVMLQQKAFLRGGQVGGADVRLIAVADPVGHVRLGDADSEIIDRALALEARTSARITFLTGDTGAELKATAAGLHVTKIPTPDPEAA